MVAPDPFEEDIHPAGGEDNAHALLLRLGSYEGPIDALLQLAREQKVDLRAISILELAEQYLSFIAELREHALEIAADYLVMAAWLAYLKSRLLLPPDPRDAEPSGEEMAAALQFQLQRLEAMQEAGRRLLQRPRLGRETFSRGAGEGVTIEVKRLWDATFYDLLRAYADFKRREGASALEIEPLTLYPVEKALKRLERLLGIPGGIPDWSVLMRFLPSDLLDPLHRRSAICAHLIASLELAKQGKLEVRQEGGAFSPILIRSISRTPQNNEETDND